MAYNPEKLELEIVKQTGLTEFTGKKMGGELLKFLEEHGLTQVLGLIRDHGVINLDVGFGPEIVAFGEIENRFQPCLPLIITLGNNKS